MAYALGYLLGALLFIGIIYAPIIVGMVRDISGRTFGFIMLGMGFGAMFTSFLLNDVSAKENPAGVAAVVGLMWLVGWGVCLYVTIRSPGGARKAMRLNIPKVFE
jgi:hypothetical protein